MSFRDIPTLRLPVLYRLSLLVAALGCPLVMVRASSAGQPSAEVFKREVRPLLVENCFGCHGDGDESGGIAFDQLEARGDLLNNIGVWQRVLKNTRAHIMPPADVATLPPEKISILENWVKREVLQLDPQDPDPGRVTLRRLNRTEYQNAVRDLTGVDYKVDVEFPPDDTGYGFDNIADVLSVAPMLLEKYVAAANTIIDETVPKVPLVPATQVIQAASFVKVEPGATTQPSIGDPSKGGSLYLSYYEPLNVARAVKLEHAGTYKITLQIMMHGRWAEKAFDYNRAEFGFSIDGQEQVRKNFGWQSQQSYTFIYERKWDAGEHQFAADIKPVTNLPDRPGENKIELKTVTIEGPMEEQYWIKPKDHGKYFGSEPIPADPQGRRALAGKILREFARKVWRRPPHDSAVQRLVDLAESLYGPGGKPFEAGVAQAMTAVLASPRFLFLEEMADPPSASQRYPLLDEFSLASRLSFFLWSSTPDEELLQLAEAHKLRENLDRQVARMLKDNRSSEFFENFPGQWLQSRDIEQVQIESRKIMDRNVLKELMIGKDDEMHDLRVSMRKETEAYFAYVVRENRSVLELVDSNYTFLNERLARHYGVPGVEGKDLRRVKLPPDSPRGGVITMGTTLMVTSNPTRTSPVKRGLFILENFLGTSPPPPPPNIPSLEDASESIKDHTPTLRETLERHRSDPTCMACHSRLDPPGLALENFNALGYWRDKDGETPIDSKGQLITGETFNNIKELKRILVQNHKQDIYRCLTEKLLTYALGRGVDYYDVETVDQIVAAMDKDGGKFATLLNGIINSAAFQRRRSIDATDGSMTSTSSASSASVSTSSRN